MTLAQPGDFRIAEAARVEAIVSFLRDNCRWSASEQPVHYQAGAGPGYDLTLRRADGTSVVFSVGERDIAVDGYQAKLSTSKMDSLDRMVGVAKVQLGPFQSHASLGPAR